jgi:hypothetical protein
MEKKDEQGERIAEEWRLAQERIGDGEELSYWELEAIFEDRDPLEFL